MPKVSSLKDLFGLISSIHAAWPTLLLLVAFVFPYIVAIPPVAFVGLGIFVLLVLALLAYKARHRFIYLPLDVAAREAYEQLDGTVWTAAAERMHDKPSVENTLDYMGQLLINGNDGVALFGNKPPSTIFKQIDSKLLKRSSVKDKCTWLKSSDSKEPPWTNLQVERRALRRRVKDMKANDLPEPKHEQPGLMHVVIPSVEQQIELMRPAAQQTNTPHDILKKMIAADSQLLIVGFLEGTNYQVGNGNLNSGYAPRELAMLQEAVEELAQKKLIRVKNKTDQFVMYEVTGAGYKEAEG
jgi:hypothetical protein